jgi:hypothetical protein
MAKLLPAAKPSRILRFESCFICCNCCKQMQVVCSLWQ